MCLSIPMRVVEWDDDEGFFAWVERGEGETLRRERVEHDADRPAGKSAPGSSRRSASPRRPSTKRTAN